MGNNIVAYSKLRFVIQDFLNSDCVQLNNNHFNKRRVILLMEKTSTTSNYDVLVIKHRNHAFKSTPFQAVFSEKALKSRENKKTKTKDLSLYINDELVDLPMRLDPNNGRVQFQKKYIRRGNISDSSDISDDERLSNRSTSKERRISGSNLKNESIQELKNEQVPKKFWQFAWLFNSKKETPPPSPLPPKKQQQSQGVEESKLARIKQQFYQGEESSKEPLFQLSLCKNLLPKMKQQPAKEEVEKMFYANRVQYKDFKKDPLAIMNDPNLVVRIDNSLYTWQIGAAVLASKFAFGKQPGEEYMNDIISKNKKKGWLTIFGSSDNVSKLDIEEKEPPIVPPLSRPEETQIIKYRKVPDSEMLTKMNLKMGENRGRFVLQIGAGQLEETQFKIFLWDENEQVIVSDIDGTITKSDVMGQLKTNYIHKGVCVLFNELYKRNYKILYMTARAIGQYTQTRRFLQKQVEENGMKLPPGPILMSPDGYLKSFAREVIEKTPDQLKIKLLASVNEIFPSSTKPIIAGFGNRQTDSIAYLRIKIPSDKIFCINEKSIITNERDKEFSTTYPQMLEKIEDFFPVYNKPEFSEAGPSSGKEKITIDENEDESFMIPRKLSHSQFYERSPKSKKKIEDDDENGELFRSGSKAKSVEGEPSIQNMHELQQLMKQFAEKQKTQ